MGYKYDVFLSYQRTLHDGTPSAEGKWVEEIFQPALKQRLNAHYPYATVAFDLEIETGARWPDALKDRLRRSRFLVPVWSAGYFTSHWCTTEWASMRAREGCLNHDPAAPGLVLPVIFGDGDFFPDEAKATQGRREYHAFSRLTRKKGKKYEKFLAAVDDLCEYIAKRVVNDCPGFKPNWPIEVGKPLPRPVIPQLGLR